MLCYVTKFPRLCVGPLETHEELILILFGAVLKEGFFKMCMAAMKDSAGATLETLMEIAQSKVAEYIRGL